MRSRRAARVLSAAAGHDAPGERGGDDAERDVDQEDGAPLAAEQVQVEQPSSQDGTRHGGQAHQRAGGTSALRRCSGGNTTFTSARPCGIITDPNRPCSVRATIRKTT